MNANAHFIKNEICRSSSVGRAQPCQGWGREFESRFLLLSARMVESVDTQDLKSCGFTAVRVQVPLRVPKPLEYSDIQGVLFFGGTHGESIRIESSTLLLLKSSFSAMHQMAKPFQWGCKTLWSSVYVMPHTRWGQRLFSRLVVGIIRFDSFG